VHGVAVVELGVPVAEDVVDGGGAQQIGTAAGLVERDRQRLAHVGHHREVQQLGDVDLEVQPARVDAVVMPEELGQLPS
jgi:hypothetical protein